jgi:hypothetical protein
LDIPYSCIAAEKPGSYWQLASARALPSLPGLARAVLWTVVDVVVHVMRWLQNGCRRSVPSGFLSDSVIVSDRAVASVVGWF